MKTRRFLLILMVLSFSLSLFAEDWLTIYNDDLSLVRSNFEISLEKGKQKFNFDDITSRIEPASVIVLGKGVRVAEQNYEYDLAGKYQILAKYIDKEVKVVTNDQSSLQGELKFYDGSSVGILENGTSRLIIINEKEIQWIQLASLPNNFYTKPTLAWSLIADKKGKHPLSLSYLSGGFSWNVTYNAVWDDENLALNSWVTINNSSGKAFEDVNLKLIAGEVNRIRERYKTYARNEMYDMVESMAMGAAAPSFEEKAFHDFHMYSLDQKVSFANNQTKQLELYPIQNVSAEGIYEYQVYSDEIRSIIKFMNTEDAGLGKPLPKGVIKVYKQDEDDNMEFIGEDSIDHTGRNEEIRINTGKAFDLVGITTTVESKTISNRVYEKEMMVTLKNNSKEEKRINVVYGLSSNAKIVKSDLRYNFDEVKRTINYTVTIPANEETSFKFRERTEW
ncbi:MAG: DUF4139 domain-containing protein [Candidatus Cloacimonetes bacterium]|jgi:hypothetical protein|nr:DUF4139 domain-containing protein [Candidatus Cloacimonadota bacterium]